MLFQYIPTYIRMDLSHLKTSNLWNMWNASLEFLEFNFFIINFYGRTWGTLWYLPKCLQYILIRFLLPSFSFPPLSFLEQFFQVHFLGTIPTGLTMPTRVICDYSFRKWDWLERDRLQQQHCSPLLCVQWTDFNSCQTPHTQAKIESQTKVKFTQDYFQNILSTVVFTVTWVPVFFLANCDHCEESTL
jgi:hypothetical protein